MRSGLRRAILAAITMLWSVPAGATDISIPGRTVMVRDGILLKLIAKPVGAFTIPGLGSAGDPLINPASVNVFDTDGTGSFNDALTGGTWQGLGSPPGSAGYKYKNPSAPAGGAVKLVILKAGLIKSLARDTGSLTTPIDGNLAIELNTGTDRRCAEFGGTEIRNIAGLYKYKDAPAPASCALFNPACCDGNGFFNFTNVTAPGDCGDMIDPFGALVSNVACGAIYSGGGGNVYALPSAAPDLGSITMAVDSCAGELATVGATTSATTGSLEKCTSVGCLFGAPRSLPNPSASPFSLCVVSTVSTAPSGTFDCGSGATNIDLGVTWSLYLTGDTGTDPGNTIPGIQACPLCSAGNCVGGANAMGACTPDTTAIDSAYPTSNDCPPAASDFVGSIPVALNLSSGTVAWTGTIATNDTGSTASVQGRVFSGYCRDLALPGGSGSFDADVAPGNQSRKCWENGMAVGSPCSEADNGAETCEQRTHGAFGPNGGNIRTVRAIGNSMSILGGPSPATLVSVFSIAPIFDATMDANMDLPGPGAVVLPGTARSCFNAMSCP